MVQDRQQQRHGGRHDQLDRGPAALDRERFRGAMMAAAAKYRDDVAGIATGGTSTAYTVTSSQAFDSLANMDGKVVAFVPHVTSGAAPVTLNVDGLGAKALRSSPGVELAAGTLIAGTPYAAVYRNAGNEWLLRGFFGANPYNVPIGAGLPFFGPVAPNSSFAFPRGQPISRTTYSALFALIGTTYGAGDGATTFALPDLSGRLLACREGLDGAPAPGRITAAGSGIDGTALGATGGAETVTLATSQLPSHTHANTLSDPGHIHGVSDPTHAHSVSDPTHAHGVSDPTQRSSSTPEAALTYLRADLMARQPIPMPPRPASRSRPPRPASRSRPPRPASRFKARQPAFRFRARRPARPSSTPRRAAGLRTPT